MAPFQLPDNLHPDCAPIAWLLGRWEGRGHGDYPTIEKFEYGQEVVFSQDGRPFFFYTSRTWLLDADGTAVRPLAMESGFWRARPESELEVVLSHPTGFAEIWYGSVDGAKVELRTDLVARTTSAKEYTAGHRLYGLVDGALMYAYDMAAMGRPLQPHLWAKLERADAP